MKFFKIVLLVILLSACATSPTGRKQLLLVSPEQAINASKQAYVSTISDLNKKQKLNVNQTMTQRVKKITERLVKVAKTRYPETQNWQWEVNVIDDDKTVNAWCMAGGKMAMYSGLITQLKASDDEIAQVMGHEIAHALSNHSAEKMSIALASQVGLQGLSIALNEKKYASLALSGAALAAKLAVELPNSRTAESESDKVGVELAARAGYHPAAAVSLWDKMGALQKNQPPEFLSTHPSPNNRKKVLKSLIPEMLPIYQQAKR